MVLTRSGITAPPSRLYSTVTWVLASGRSQGVCDLSERLAWQQNWGMHNRVRDLITGLVGVTLADRLGGEEEVVEGKGWTRDRGVGPTKASWCCQQSVFPSSVLPSHSVHPSWLCAAVSSLTPINICQPPVMALCFPSTTVNFQKWRRIKSTGWLSPVGNESEGRPSNRLKVFKMESSHSVRVHCDLVPCKYHQ